jgi:hypothetical protein
MKARQQRTQNSAHASRPHWQGKSPNSLRESWSTAPAATVPSQAPQTSVAPSKVAAVEVTRETLPPHPSSQTVDLEALEQRFFDEGMSDDALAAASAREQERELELPGTGRASKLLLGGAMCTALAVVITGTVMRQVNGGGAPRVALASTQMVATPAATPPAAPATPTPPSVVDVAGLRAGAAPAQAAAVAAVAPADEPPAQDFRTACDQVLRRGRFRDINQWCAAAFAAAPSAELAGRVAELALDRGRHGDAAVWARRAIHENPRFALAFVYLGGAEQELGHADAARAAYNRYLSLDPEGQHADDVRALLAAGE